VSVLWALAAKDLRLLVRDKADLFWILGFPIVLALFFGSISGGGGPRAAMPVAVVDQDASTMSRSIIERLRSSEGLKVRDMPIDSARLFVRRGDLAAYILFQPGVGASFGFGGDSTSGVEIGVDPRRSAEREFLRGFVTAALFQSLQGSFGADGTGQDQIHAALDRLKTDVDGSPERRERRGTMLRSLESFMVALDASRKLDAEERTGAENSDEGAGGGPNLRIVEVAENDSGPRSAYEITFPSSIAWALIGVCMSFAVSIVQERMTGTFLRLRLAPIGRATILAGKGLACATAAAVAVTVVLCLGVFVFGVRIANPPLLLAAIGASAFCFTGVMMVVSVLGKSPPSVSGAGWALMLMMSMTGGGMIPLIAMPAWMQTVSNYSLVKHAIVAVEGAVWRGFGWHEAMAPLGILIGAGLVGMFLGSRILRTDRP
jgi:ABC-2 type transport system permease protein